jgi:hypothetical protein
LKKAINRNFKPLNQFTGLKADIDIILFYGF